MLTTVNLFYIANNQRYKITLNFTHGHLCHKQIVALF